jgi:cobalt-zinc-cadmium efflux system outer membrane protein
MVRNAVAFAWIAAAAAGCTTFHDEPISLKATAAFDARRLGSPELKAFLEGDCRREMALWSPKAWGFDLLALAACYYHPQVKVA